MGFLAALVLGLITTPSIGAEPEVATVVVRDPELDVIVRSLEDLPPKEDVSVTIEGGYAEVTEVQRLIDSHLPVATALLVDTSGSMQPSFNDVLSAIRGFVNGMAGSDVAIIVTFSDEVEGSDADWQGSSERDALMSRVDALAADGQETHLYEALNAAVDRLTVDKADYPLRTVLVLSDGADFGSPDGRSLERVRANAVRHNVAISSVGYITGSEDATPILRDLAMDTGGRFRLASDAESIEQMFTEFQTMVHNLVVVTAEAETVPAGSHELGVRIQGDEAAVEATHRLELESRFVGQELPGNDEADYTLVYLAVAVVVALGAGTALIGAIVLAVVTQRRREQALQSQVREAQETARQIAAEVAAPRLTRCCLQGPDGTIQLFGFDEFGERVLGADLAQVDVMFDHPNVSGTHAKLERRPDDPDAVYITDLDSSNGTYHQGLDIRGRGTVRAVHGERVQFGLLATHVDIGES